MGNQRRVRCMECDDRIPRSQAIRIQNEAGELVGYLCRECE
jgi:ribosomal protein S26